MPLRTIYSIQRWLMIIMIVSQLFFLLQIIPLAYFTIELFDKIANTSYTQYIREQCIIQVISVLVLIAESIVWWRMRKLPYNKIWFWGYVLPLIAILVVLPFDAWLNRTLYLFFVKKNNLFFWGAVILSHACLVLALNQAYSIKDKSRGNSLGDILGESID